MHLSSKYTRLFSVTKKNFHKKHVEQSKKKWGEKGGGLIKRKINLCNQIKTKCYDSLSK